MARIPQSFIQDLVERIDIVDVVHAHVPLKKRGANFVACCPFHNEKSPSFTVSQPKQFYHCFGCGAHGNVISFLMEFERLEFVEAIEELAKQIGMEVPRETNTSNTPQPNKQNENLYTVLERVSQFYHRQLSEHDKGSSAVSYLNNRGLQQAIIQRFQLGYAPPGWDSLSHFCAAKPKLLQSLITTGMLIRNDQNRVYDRFRDRVMFPIHDRRGRVIAFGGRTLGDDTPKYLNSPETPLYHKGREAYGLYQARQCNRELDSLIIVEGYMDVIALHQHDITNVVATLGTAATEEHMQTLLRYCKQLVFCFDGDQAGTTAAWRALNNLLPHLQDGVQASFMFLPQGDDPDSLVNRDGKEGFLQQMQQKSSFSDFFFKHLLMGADTSTLDGKASLAKTAAPLFAKIPQSFLKQMLVTEFAKRLRIDQALLDNWLVDEVKPTVKKSVSFNPHSTPSPMRLAMALLIQNPSLAQSLQTIPAIDLPGGNLLLELLEFMQNHPNISTGGLLEYWRDHENHKILAKLASWPISVPAQGIKTEFIAALNKLLELSNDRQIEQLLAISAAQGLSSEERQHLTELIAKKHATGLDQNPE